MSRGHDRGRLDWLVELAGACAPATAAAYSAAMLAPDYGVASGAALLVGFGTVFAVAFGVMRLVAPEERRLALPPFEQSAMLEDELLLDDVLGENELMLETPYAADELLLDLPLVQPADLSAVAELLLDDPLPAPAVDSRVVQLFAGNRMPTAGQLQRRIDRHLAGDEQHHDRAPTPQDASDALSEALAELRRSLRQA